MPIPAIGHLPAELVLQVAEGLRDDERKHLAQTSVHFRRIVGPLVYHSQSASNVEHLVRLKTLAEDAEIAAMITDLFVDGIEMSYWWLGVARLLSTTLPLLTSLKSLTIRLSHLLSPAIACAIARLPCLHNLSIQVREVPLGPHVRVISGMRRIELDMAPPNATYFPTVSCAFGDMVGFISSSKDTLEALSLYSYTTECTDGFVKHLAPNGSFEKLLHSCPHLTSLSIRLEVSTNAAATIEAIDALAGLPVTHLHLKCKPTMFPDTAPNGYGMGVEVLERISERLPALQELWLEDGDVGKVNLIDRSGEGEVFGRHISALTHLPNLVRAEFALLLDDVLQHESASSTAQLDEDSSISTLEKATTPDSEPNPRLQFEATVQSTVETTVKSLLLANRPGDDLEERPMLPKLKTLTFHLYPTPQLARDLRGFRLHVPVVKWAKEVVRREFDGQPRSSLIDL